MRLKKWNNGEIYDSREGNTQSLFAKLNDQKTYILEDKWIFII